MSKESRIRQKTHLIFYFLIVFIIAVSDQIAKQIVFARLEVGESIPLIKGIFHITLILNKGIAFGLLTEHLNLLMFIVFTTALFILTIFLRYARGERLLIKLGLSFMLGGCLGNLVDRVRLGVVIDFLDLKIWPVFNIADTAVCIGAFLLIVGLISRRRIRYL